MAHGLIKQKSVGTRIDRCDECREVKQRRRKVLEVPPHPCKVLFYQKHEDMSIIISFFFLKHIIILML